MKITCCNCGRQWGGLAVSHCSGCHVSFSTPKAFDAHQKLTNLGVRCRPPSTVGLVFDQDRELFRFMTPDEEKDSASTVQVASGR